MRNAVDQAVVRLDAFRNKFGKRTSSLVDSFADEVSGVAKSADAFVRARPWGALGAVALVGMAAGVLLVKGARSGARRESTSRTAAGSELAGG